MKIEKFYNKKAGREQFRARFQLHRKEYTPVADTKKRLLEIVDEIRANQHRSRYDLPVSQFFPTVAELLNEHLTRLRREGDRKKVSIFRRVSEDFVSLVGAGLSIDQLRNAHFQRYIDQRLSEKNSLSGAPIQAETVNKELSALSVAFKRAGRYFASVGDDWQIKVPKIAVKQRRRERLVSRETELDRLLEFLRRPHPHSSTERSRRELADELEMRYLTGFRRKELSMLKASQFVPNERALRDVRRWKTGTVTKFFPLTDRAVEIIEERISAGGEFLFSTNGKPNEARYQQLKKACEELEIPYGTYTEGGWVPHDLRHNFSTEIVRVTDIETAKSLTGHSGSHILTYLHTDESRQREAMDRREGKDMTARLTELYNEVKADRIDLSSFLETARSLIRNG